jgi:RNA polymerase sigma-70 factor (ECF subfamily)
MKKPELESDVLASLVEKARRGDPEAVTEVIELVQDRLFSFCLHLSGNRQYAEDLCQETLVKAFAQVGSLKDNALFLSWAVKVAKNIYLDQVKLKKVKNESLRRIFDDSDEPSWTSDGEAGDPASVLEVREALQRLSEEDRAILLLVDMEGYSYSEAAAIMELSEAAIRSRLSRARTLFLKIYENS